MPFSVLTLPELLLGELGPEPGALLHAESVGERQQVGVGHWRDIEHSTASLGFCFLAYWQAEQGRISKQGWQHDSVSLGFAADLP